MKNNMLIGLLSAGVLVGGALTVSAATNTNVEEQTPKVTESQEVISKDSQDGKQQSSKQDILSEQEAIDIAKKTVNGTVTEMELDEDDNRYVYEFELDTDNREAEVEIDAVTGKVLEKEFDDDDDDDSDD